MSSYNPRVIAHKLDDLQAELTRWAGAARDTLEQATYTQRQSKESVERVMQQAAIVLDQAKQDEEDVQQARSTVESVLAQSLEAQNVSQQTLDTAQEMLQLANQTLEFWKAELAKALAWLKRAEARLAEAIRQYEQARRALAAAQSRLNSAISAYNRCARDPDRRNCNREAAAVHAARGAVQQASVAVQVAEQEVLAAQLEVEQAKARVACCQRAVGFAQQAVGLAQESKSHAVDAVNSAERSLEFAHSADKTSLVAEEKAVAEMETAENMISTMHRARTLNDDAFMHLKMSDDAEDSAQRYVSIARQEIGHRVQLLREINRPSRNDGQSSSRTQRATASGSSKGISELEAYAETQVRQLEGGNSKAHAADKHGPNVSDKFLRQRVQSGKDRATKFTSWNEMNTSIQETLNNHKADIEARANSGRQGVYPYDGPFVDYTGWSQRGRIQGQAPVRVFIWYDGAGKWGVYTAYPQSK